MRHSSLPPVTLYQRPGWLSEYRVGFLSATAALFMLWGCYTLFWPVPASATAPVATQTDLLAAIKYNNDKLDRFTASYKRLEASACHHDWQQDAYYVQHAIVVTDNTTRDGEDSPPRRRLELSPAEFCKNCGLLRIKVGPSADAPKPAK